MENSGTFVANSCAAEKRVALLSNSYAGNKIATVESSWFPDWSAHKANWEIRSVCSPLTQGGVPQAFANRSTINRWKPAGGLLLILGFARLRATTEIPECATSDLKGLQLWPEHLSSLMIRSLSPVLPTVLHVVSEQFLRLCSSS